MRITKYKTKKDEEGHAYLVKEYATNYPESHTETPANIVKMLNAVFELDKETEEYLYLLCFNSKMKLLGVFEISHGVVNASLVSPREVFQKALLCNASNIVIAHNHPSGEAKPSEADYEVSKRIKAAGELMSVPLKDSIIVGDNCYFSFYESTEII